MTVAEIEARLIELAEEIEEEEQALEYILMVRDLHYLRDEDFIDIEDDHLLRHGGSVLTALTPQECLDIAFARIRELTDADICLGCAIRMVSMTYDIDRIKLATLYIVDRC